MRAQMHDAIIKAIWDETEDRRAINIKHSTDWVSVDNSVGDRALLIQIGPLSTDGAHNFDLIFVEDLGMTEQENYVRGTIFSNNEKKYSFSVRGRSYKDHKTRDFINKLIAESKDNSFLGVCRHLSNYMIWEYANHN